MTDKPLSPVGVALDAQEIEGGLHLDYLVGALKRHFLLIVGVTTLIASAAVLKAVTEEPIYQAGFELLTPSVTPESQLASGIPDSLSEFADSAVDEITLKVLKSPRVMEPVLEELQERYPNISYGQVVSKLDISPNSTGDILTVSYRNPDPERVIHVLDVVLDAYLRYSLENRQNDISRGINFVDEQLPLAREQVQELEARLERLRQDYNLIDPLSQGEQLTQQTAKFSSQQFDLRVEIEQTQALYQDLQRELERGEELAATSALSESGRYQSLLGKLTEIDTELANELTLYLDDSPEIEVLKDRRANLQPLIEKEGTRVQDQVASRIRELNDQDQALNDIIEVLNQRIKSLSTVTRQYNDIQRELEIATINLNQFLTKREALRIDAAQRQTPWELLAPAGKPKASSASAKRNLILGTALGLILGAGIAIAWDRIRGKINTLKELKDTARLPLLGTIPHNQLLESGQSLAFAMTQLGELGFDMDLAVDSNHAESTPFLEAFKRLSTNLRLNNPDTHLQSLTISSAIPNAGKSTISFHLAHTNASMGQRTLLVDVDLRRPTLHRICHVSNEKGLSNYITGESDLEDVLIDLPVNEKLYMVSAGPIPPDPVQLLTSKRMEMFIQEAYKKFDMIIFDTPPLLGFADAFITAGKTQGLLLAVRLEHIKFSQLNAAMEELSISKVPVIGMVANGHKQEGEGSGYYDYYRRPSELPSETLEYSHSHTNGSIPSSWQKTLLSPINKYWGKK